MPQYEMLMEALRDAIRSVWKVLETLKGMPGVFWRPFRHCLKCSGGILENAQIILETRRSRFRVCFPMFHWLNDKESSKKESSPPALPVNNYVSAFIRAFPDHFPAVLFLEVENWRSNEKMLNLQRFFSQQSNIPTFSQNQTGATVSKN